MSDPVRGARARVHPFTVHSIHVELGGAKVDPVLNHDAEEMNPQGGSEDLAHAVV
jgi:hypothetical protein